MTDRQPEFDCGACGVIYDNADQWHGDWGVCSYCAAKSEYTAKLIAEWLRKTDDIWRPISSSRVVKCAHGYYGWEDCGECAVTQVADAIERGDWAARTACPATEPSRSAD